MKRSLLIAIMLSFYATFFLLPTENASAGFWDDVGGWVDDAVDDTGDWIDDAVDDTGDFLGISCVVDATCGDDSYCDWSTSSCKERGDAGDACIPPLVPPFNATCKSDLVCDGGTSKCANVPRQEGEGCGAFDPCGEDLYCAGDFVIDSVFAGICEQKKGAGAECFSASECKDELDCILTYDSGKICLAEYASDGEPYDRDSCLAFYSEDVHNAAKLAQTALTFGVGSTLSLGVSGSGSSGVAYGDEGSYGCYYSYCEGGETTAGISFFATTGEYPARPTDIYGGTAPGYDSIRGSSISIVQSMGFGKFGSFSITEYFNTNWDAVIGFEESFAVGAGLPIPISVGLYSCNTVLYTYKAEYNGAVITIPENYYGLSPELQAFFASLNEAPVALCESIDQCYDASTCTVDAVEIDAGSYDPDSDPITVVQDFTGPFTKGSYDVSLTVTDDSGESDTCSSVVTIRDCEPPTVTCLEEKTVECAGPATDVLLISSASDVCEDDPAFTNNDPELFALGETIVDYYAEDAAGNNASCSTVVTVEDTLPPVIEHLTAIPDVLWPPTNKMVDVFIDIVASDICDTDLSCEIVDVVNSSGDSTDMEIIGKTNIKLRAERSGDVDERIYTVVVECIDSTGGNSVQKNVTVTVPHDQGKKKR